MASTTCNQLSYDLGWKYKYVSSCWPTYDDYETSINVQPGQHIWLRTFPLTQWSILHQHIWHDVTITWKCFPNYWPLVRTSGFFSHIYYVYVCESIVFCCRKLAVSCLGLTWNNFVDLNRYLGEIQFSVCDYQNDFQNLYFEMSIFTAIFPNLRL